MQEIIQDPGGIAEDDFFERHEEEDESQAHDFLYTPTAKVARTVGWLKEELGRGSISDSSGLLCLQVPVFLGHGPLDEKVPSYLGQEVAMVLRELGIDVHWVKYEGLGHWYSDEMLRDIVSFIRSRSPSHSGSDTVSQTMIAFKP